MSSVRAAWGGATGVACALFSVPESTRATTRLIGVAGCFTCEVNAGKRHAPGGTIYEDDHWLADHGVSRLVRGYVVLKPKRHVHELADLLPIEATTMGLALQHVLAAMRTALDTERIYVCSFAESVHHLHFHLLPRYADMPGLGPDLVPALFSEQWRCSVEEAEVAAGSIRLALSDG
jgi:diadenosine tetraphosphate (Ap4A) HIT family hydrolase